MTGIRKKLQLWALANGEDVLALVVLCAEHAAWSRDADFVLPPGATHSFRVRSGPFMEMLRGSNGCGECALRDGTRKVRGLVVPLRLKAARLAADGGDA